MKHLVIFIFFWLPSALCGDDLAGNWSVRVVIFDRNDEEVTNRSDPQVEGLKFAHRVFIGKEFEKGIRNLKIDFTEASRDVDGKVERPFDLNVIEQCHLFINQEEKTGWIGNPGWKENFVFVKNKKNAFFLISPTISLLFQRAEVQVKRKDDMK